MGGIEFKTDSRLRGTGISKVTGADMLLRSYSGSSLHQLLSISFYGAKGPRRLYSPIKGKLARDGNILIKLVSGLCSSRTGLQPA
jgi:hypothetical protein